MPKDQFRFERPLRIQTFDLSIATFGALNYHVSDDIHNSLNSCYGWGNKDVAMLDANRFSEDGSTYLSSVPRTMSPTVPAWPGTISSRPQKFRTQLIGKIANIELGYNFPQRMVWQITYRMYVSTCRHRTCTPLPATKVTMWTMQEVPSHRDITSVLILPHVPSCVAFISLSNH